MTRSGVKPIEFQASLFPSHLLKQSRFSVNMKLGALCVDTRPNPSGTSYHVCLNRYLSVEISQDRGAWGGRGLPAPQCATAAAVGLGSVCTALAAAAVGPGAVRRESL